MAGVCFAVTLLFMQLGFFASVSLIAMLTYDKLTFDIVIASPHYVMLAQAGTFPEQRMYQAQAHPDVENVLPLYVRRQTLRNPETRYRRGILVLGIRPNDPISNVPELEEQRHILSRPNTFLVDRQTRPEVGVLEPGVVTEVGRRQLTSVGQFPMGPGLEAGLIVVSDKTFSTLFGGIPLSDVNLGLVQVRNGADPKQVAKQLQATLPKDVRVMTRSELRTHETRYWVTNTSTGIIFGCGVVVAIFFSIVITYQVLSMEVTHRLSEYATLKALGFSDFYLIWVVLQQAVIFAIVSYFPGCLFALGIYHLTGSVTGLPIGMTWERAVSVFLLNLLLCGLSGTLATRILRKADPVDLF